MIRPTLAIFLVLFLASGAGDGAAQPAGSELSESEIIQRFEQQRTRGLVIAPASDGGVASGAGTEVYQEVPTDIQVNINISFDFDSSALREDQKPKLVTLCNVIRESDDQSFRIIGHTDATGSPDYNEQLSRLRAEEVKRYLVGDCGIAQSRLEAVGVGMRFPYDAENPRGSENRRVEFQLMS